MDLNSIGHSGDNGYDSIPYTHGANVWKSGSVLALNFCCLHNIWWLKSAGHNCDIQLNNTGSEKPVI